MNFIGDLFDEMVDWIVGCVEITFYAVIFLGMLWLAILIVDFGVHLCQNFH